MPILQALDAIGGRGNVGGVLARVEQLMEGSPTVVDDEPLASEPEMLCWRSAGQWARYSVVQEGFLKPDSPSGVGEISEAGRRSLEALPRQGRANG